MKKTLTCLAALGLAVASTANSAEQISLAGFTKPAVTLSGKVQAFAFGKSVVNAPKGVDKVTGGTKGNLRLNIMGTSQAGTEYGAIAEMDFRRDRTASQDFWRAIYVYFSSPEYGMWQLGDLEGAIAQTMVDGKNLLGGTGGFWGDMWAVATPTTGVMYDFSAMSSTKYATKIVYKSPIMSGFQVVMSFTPHSKLWGLQNRNFDKDFVKAIATGKAPSVSQVSEAAISYGFELGDVGVNLYAGGAIGSPDVPANSGYRLHSIKVWQAGMLLDWKQFQFATGVVNNQRSMMRTDEVGNAGTAYNAALSYTMGRHTFAVGYFGSTRRVTEGRAKSNVGSLTYECQLAPGWSVFGEANYFKTTNTGAYLEQAGIKDATSGRIYTSGLDKNNSGGVFLLGTSIRF